jgi:hypothetical protein
LWKTDSAKRAIEARVARCVGGIERRSDATLESGANMMVAENTQIAEAVGRRVLGWKGAEFLEFIYLLEEKNTLDLLREFVALSDDNQIKVIEFFRMAKAQENYRINVDSFGIVIQPEMAKLD